MHKWYLIDALGRSESEVGPISPEPETIRFLSPRLHFRWTGDPTQDPLAEVHDMVITKGRAAIRKGNKPDLVQTLQEVLTRETDDSFYLHQIRFRAGLAEGDLSIDQMKRPLADWPDEILERILPVLAEIAVE